MRSPLSPRGQLRKAVEKVTRSTTVWRADALASSSAVDLAVSSAFTCGELAGVVDPLAAGEFLRAAWSPLVVDVQCLKSPQLTGAEGSGREQQLLTLIETLSGSIPSFGYAQALELCRYSDSLRARREPFVRPRFSADAGLHATIASSYAKKGRVLAAMVRFMRPEHVIEIGTAYGMSALFLAAELQPGGIVVSIEASHPQIDIARDLLAEHRCADQISLIEGFSHDVLDQVAAQAPGASLLFHDGAHSSSAYVRDFNDYLPLLAPGAIVLFDDIRWEDSRWHAGQANTYSGWLEVVAHSAVRSAFELDGELGVVQLHSAP